jgi:uncharacterized Tic20 family protein
MFVQVSAYMYAVVVVVTAMLHMLIATAQTPVVRTVALALLLIAVAVTLVISVKLGAIHCNTDYVSAQHYS